MPVKKKLYFKPKRVWDDKEMDQFYKRLDKAKKPDEFRSIIYQMMNYFATLDYRQEEIVKFVGKRRTYL